MCDKCDVLVINGNVCHELGCTNTPRECKNCDETAVDGHFCSAECRNDYYGIPDDEFYDEGDES